MARISEFDQRGTPDKVEIAISPEEYANLGTDPGQLRLRLSTFTRSGEEFENHNLATDQSAWTLDPNTNEYYIIVRVNGQHNAFYQGIALGSLSPTGEASEVFDAYMIGTFANPFDFSLTSDTVTSSVWLPVGTPFTDIDQSSPENTAENGATVRWDSPDINTPVVTDVSGLNSTGNGPLCLAAGTNVLTNKGEVPVEALRPGDLVETADHGLQPIKWVHGQSISQREMMENPKLAPVWVSKDSFGPNCPSKDMRLSRQHRILVRTASFSEQEVLVPAVKLAHIPEVKIDATYEKITYFHILLDRHEIIMADNLLVESLLLGPQTTKQLGINRVREAAAAVTDPVLASVPARPIVERISEVKKLTIKNQISRRMEKHQMTSPRLEMAI